MPKILYQLYPTHPAFYAENAFSPVAAVPQQQRATDQVEKLQTLQLMNAVPLLSVKTVFPFRVFPAIVTLDREKLTISDHYFFSSRETESILIQDLTSVTVSENAFFSTLTLTIKPPVSREISVSHLPRQDARRLRRLINGLQVAAKEGIDVLKIDTPTLVKRLEQIGAEKV